MAVVGCRHVIRRVRTLSNASSPKYLWPQCLIRVLISSTVSATITVSFVRNVVFVLIHIQHVVVNCVEKFMRKPDNVRVAGYQRQQCIFQQQSSVSATISASCALNVEFFHIHIQFAVVEYVIASTSQVQHARK